MGLVTRRPDTAETSTPGNWTRTPSSGAGSTVAEILEDDSDLTFMSIAIKSTLPTQVAKFDIVDLTTADIPDGSKIVSVTLWAKALQIAPAGGSSFLTDILRFAFLMVEQVLATTPGGSLGDFIINIFRHVYHVPVPTPPGGASPTWQYLRYTFPGRPSGGEWDLASLNSIEHQLSRTDNNPTTTKISEYGLDVEFNEPPSVEIIGPTETRVVTNGVTTNADATVTSATAAFTANDVGASISGTGIPGGTTIASINSATSVELSANATATATGVTVTITRVVISTTTRPIFTIDYDDPEGDLQAAVRFRVFTAAQAALGSFDVNTTPPYVASPGTDNWLIGQSTQWLSTRDLENGDYVVFAQVKQVWSGVSPHVSQWDAYDFTVDVEGPDQPVLTATPDDTNNWIQLDVIPSGDNVPAVETYTFYRSDNAGIDWWPVWGGWQVPADEVTGAATLRDHLGPLNHARYYKVLGYRTLGTVKVASDESEWVFAVPASREFWIKDPLAPTLNQPIGWMDDSPEQNRDQGIHIPLVADGMRAYAIVVDGPLQGISGDSKLLFIEPDDSAWEKWKAIRALGHTLMLQYPTGEQHWVMLKGDAKWTWHTDATTEVSFRILEWGYIEVKRPIDPDTPTGVQQP